MSKRSSTRAKILKRFSKYEWFDRYRCCDQEYKVRDDAWDARLVWRSADGVAPRLELVHFSEPD